MDKGRCKGASSGRRTATILLRINEASVSNVNFINLINEMDGHTTILGKKHDKNRATSVVDCDFSARPKALDQEEGGMVARETRDHMTNHSGNHLIPITYFGTGPNATLQCQCR